MAVFEVTIILFTVVLSHLLLPVIIGRVCAFSVNGLLTEMSLSTEFVTTLLNDIPSSSTLSVGLTGERNNYTGSHSVHYQYVIYNNVQD